MAETYLDFILTQLKLCRIENWQPSNYTNPTVTAPPDTFIYTDPEFLQAIPKIAHPDWHDFAEIGKSWDRYTTPGYYQKIYTSRGHFEVPGLSASYVPPQRVEVYNPPLTTKYHNGYNLKLFRAPSAAQVKAEDIYLRKHFERNSRILEELVEELCFKWKWSKIY